MFLIFINIATSIREFKYYKFIILLKIFENCFLTKTKIEILCKASNRSLSFVHSRNIDRRNSNSTFNSLINNIFLIDAQFSLVIFLSLYYIIRLSTQFEILRIEYRCKTSKTILLKIENFFCVQDLKESIKLELKKITSNIIFLRDEKSERLNVDNEKIVVVNIKAFLNVVVNYSILTICLLLIRNNIQQLSSLYNRK